MRELVFAVAVSLFLAPVAIAQNLISNGDFESDTSGWLVVNMGSLTYDANFDADADPTSGSARIANLTALGYGAMTARQCIEKVNPGDTYDFGGAVYFDSQTNAANTRGHIVIYAIDNPGCGGGELVGGDSAQEVYSSQTSDTWVWTETQNFTVPVEAQSVQILLFSTRQDAPNGASEVLFDNVFFSPVPEPGAGGLAMMALFTLAWLRRREPAEE